jgi:dTDP-glucose 4,6-dehydratase
MPGYIYNIGGRSERSNLQVVRAVLQGLGKPEDLIRFVGDRPGHDLRYVIDSSKIERELGWRTEHGYAEGLELTIKWYVENVAWLTNVSTKLITTH